ncbi:MAG: PAS domain-containing protein [Methanoregula sp.]|jgi:PAS domain S-box-containing protein
METDPAVFRELVECQQDLIVKFSPEGRLQFVNAAYCDLVGKTKEELAGAVFMPVTSERYTDALATHMTKLFRAPYTCMVDQWIPSLRGLRCISWSARSLRNDQGKVTAIVATGRDVTRQKEEQRATKRKDDDLMLVIESGKPMFYTHTPDHSVMFVSPRLRTLLGCAPHAGKRLWTDYLSDNPVNGQGLERTIKAVASGRREPPYRLEFLRPDDTRVWVEVNEIPVVRSGKVVAIAGSLIDVTEKKRVDEGLVEAEVLLKGYGSHKTGGSAQRPAAAKAKSPFSFFASIFSKDTSAEEEEESFDIPANLR